MKRFCWPVLLAVSVVLWGCSTTRYVPGKPLTGDPYIDGQNAIQYGPPKDKVLWEYRTAVVAMRRGQFTEAKQLLDDAIARISNVLGKDESARKARGYFNPEAKKTFIGEPYERVMAYYYRGILYWMDGELDNARACFRSAQLEDSDTVEKKYSSDYVLLDYLDGLASLKLSGDGSDALQRATQEAKMSAPPPYNPKANMLLFVDFGSGPTKYAAGHYNELLMIMTGGIFGRAGAEIDEQQHVGLGIIGRRRGHFRFLRGALQGIRSITREFQAGEAIKVIQQHVVTGILLFNGVAIFQLRAAETSARVVQFAIHPIKDATIVIGHDALVRLADEGLLRFRVEVASRFARRL